MQIKISSSIFQRQDNFENNKMNSESVTAFADTGIFEIV